MPGESIPDSSLFDRLSVLVETTRATVAVQADAALTLMNWEIGRLIAVEVLQRERAGYDQQIVARLSQQLSQRFGRGFTTSGPLDGGAGE